MNYKCEIQSCQRRAKFSIRRIKDDKWYDICGTHDSFIGVENLIELGCGYQEARDINKEVKNHKD